MTANGSGAPRAVIFGCAGTGLGAEEKAFFAETEPLGFILFARNIKEPRQVRDLVSALRECVGRPDAPILIDQEGGRVARLGPPHWPVSPPAAVFGVLAASDRGAARRAVRANSRLLGSALKALGINMDCLPVLDLNLPQGHGIIGDRAYGADPERVAELGQAACDGLKSAGIAPVMKHIPGHGRATVDSHLELPRVDAAAEDLERLDFVPFQKLATMPIAMTAHVVYGAYDDQPATISKVVIETVIRGKIGFDGLLLSDDLCMEALAGSPGTRAQRALAAGCDVVLHCNGDLGEMRDVANNADYLSPRAEKRVAQALSWCGPAVPCDIPAVRDELAQLLVSVQAST